MCAVSVGDGVRGELVNSDGEWRVGNADEICTLMALGEDTGTLGLLNALAQTLNFGLIRTTDLGLLSSRFRWTFDTCDTYVDPMDLSLSDDGLDQAFLFTCAHSDNPEHQRYLGMTLLRRLTPNAVNGTLWIDYQNGVHWSTGSNYPPPSPYCDKAAADVLATMPRSFWAALRRHPDHWLRDMAVVTDPRTTPLRLRRFISDRRPGILTAVALHPNATSGLQRAMLRRATKWSCNSERLDDRLGAAIACNRRTARRMLRKVARGGGEARFLVTMHPNIAGWMLPEFILEAAADKDVLTLMAIAGNSQTPPSSLDVLAAFDDAQIVSVVAGNPAAPKHLVELLSKHRHRSVRVAAVLNPVLNSWDAARRAADPSLEVRAAVAARTDAPYGVLKAFAADEKTQVRVAVADNPNTPVGVLRMLGGDSDSRVRRAAASHPNTPHEILEEMAADPNLYLRYCVAWNPGAPPGILAKLATSTENTQRSVAGNPSASAEVLTKLAGHESWIIRAQVAANPSAPRAVLKRLVGDDIVCVRRAASRSLRQPARPSPRTRHAEEEHGERS